MSDKKEDAGSFPPRLITLAGAINMDAVTQVSELLAAMNAVSREPITINIVSSGGMMAAGAALYDLIRCSPAPVTTVGYGIVASAAVIVFQAGAVRLLAPSARIVLHEAKMGVEAEMSAHDLLMAAREIALEDERLDKLVAVRSRQPLARIQKWSQETKEFFAAEAIKHRLADGVLDQPRRPRARRPKRRAKA
jgi:ATP-dependent Clp protease protease subunit